MYKFLTLTQIQSLGSLTCLSGLLQCKATVFLRTTNHATSFTQYSLPRGHSEENPYHPASLLQISHQAHPPHPLKRQSCQRSSSTTLWFDNTSNSGRQIPFTWVLGSPRLQTGMKLGGPQVAVGWHTQRRWGHTARHMTWLGSRLPSGLEVGGSALVEISPVADHHRRLHGGAARGVDSGGSSRDVDICHGARGVRGLPVWRWSWKAGELLLEWRNGLVSMRFTDDIFRCIFTHWCKRLRQIIYNRTAFYIQYIKATTLLLMSLAAEAVSLIWW